MTKVKINGFHCHRNISGGISFIVPVYTNKKTGWKSAHGILQRYLFNGEREEFVTFGLGKYNGVKIKFLYEMW